jgi:hypothetical protein
MTRFIRWLVLSFALLLSPLFARVAQANTITAASCNVSDVQTAINAANNGDTVIIPNGSCSWSNGITTTKQIWIRAQNYTPTSGGTGTRSVTITNNASVPLFGLTSGNIFNVRLSGIRFNEGTGTNNHLRLSGSGTKVPLIDDDYFEIKNRFGNNPDAAAIAWTSLGGVMWNAMLQGVGGGLGGQCCPEGASLLINSPRLWYSNSTLGSLDTNGDQNIYIEDSTLKDFGQSPDIDDNGRVVIRHCLLDGTSSLTHGFTSAFGGRHFEYYNDTFTTTSSSRNIAGRYFWARAGTGVFTDDVVNTQNQGFGTPILLDSIVEGGGSYPKSRQVGWGWDNGLDHIDPVYIWNNSGAGAYAWGTSSPTFIQQNREIFVNNGAKPNYAKFTYPHPLRGAGGTPAAPSNLSAVVQ